MLGIDLTAKPNKMTMERLTQKLGPIEPESLRPSLDFSGLSICHAKAKHCHTFKLTRMTEGFSSLRGEMAPQEVELVCDDRLVRGAVIDVEVVDVGVGA